ncbi:MAG: efflux transporter outer membrane subunit [Nitrospinae bacterium]|nr:efflux transporter outer membrane subunit [Nitrospinota bacterium]
MPASITISACQKHRRLLSRGIGLGLAIGLALAGCAVGPDFKSPSAPKDVGDVYGSPGQPTTTEAATGSKTGDAGAAQRVVYGSELPAQWWTLFHSDALDQLIRSALKQNPTLASARAALRQAGEIFNAESGALNYPNVGGQLGAARNHAFLYSVTASDFTLYNATVNVSYMLDVFGASRRQIESQAAVVDYQRFELEAAYQMLVSNVVTTAIREASLRAQLQALQKVLDAQQKQLEVIEKQVALGAVARSVELAQRTQVAQTKAMLAPLEKSLAQARHQLAVYVGKLPGESGLPEFRLDSLQLPQNLPVSLPSLLVRQRPDVRANEALLHAAGAQVGVAASSQYPQINLTGSIGVTQIQLGGLSASSALWNLGAGLTQPIFNGGALSAKRRAAEAAYEQAEAQYRWTVLTAFQDVADNLRAIDADAVILKAQANAESLARESLEITNNQYELGGVSYLSLLDAERGYQQARVNFVAAQAARLTDTAALFASLGGGWWNRPKDDTNTDESPGGS